MTQEELLRLIAQAAEEGWKELDLAGHNLTTLPPEIGKLTQLETLILAKEENDAYLGNQLSQLPPEIGQLTNLKSLQVFGNWRYRYRSSFPNAQPGNQLSQLPETIAQLRKLQTLALSGNQFTKLPDAITQLSKLQRLALSGNQFSKLPDAIAQLVNLQSLDLSGNQFSRLPDTIAQLVNLQNLDLSGNPFAKLPEAITQLVNLQSLDLSGNQFAKLPEAIAQLVNLQSLDLSGNQLATLPDTFNQLSQLQNLDLSGNQLATLPAPITHLTNLKRLTLNGNQLTTLPKTISQLRQLQSLDLSGNQFATLPEAIGQLSRLQSLDLFSNQLSQLPQSIAKLAHIQRLDLRSNQLSKLPESIAQLTNLQHLDLSGNQFTKLPESITQLTSLQHLDLSGNQSARLPEAIAQLTNLQTLALSGNQFTKLPEAITQLNNLQRLDLSGNQLTRLPESISQLSQLQSLDLRSNQLTKLPESIGQLSQLQSLDLRSNQLTKLPESIGQLKQLQSLALRFNRLSSLPESIAQLSQLQNLGLRSNQFATLPDAITQLSQLRWLALSGNQFTGLPDSIAQLSQLQRLDLRSNQLASLPKAIFQLSQLQHLDLHANQLSSLPESIAQLSQLQHLDLSSNQLTSLPEAIGQLSQLQSLDLSVNQFASLPESITQLPHLIKLDLRGNPIPVPPEILGPKNRYAPPGNAAAILAYYFQTLDPNATEPLHEAKFIIVGEGGAGKTTLAKKLIDPNYTLDNAQKSTEGIDVLRWNFKLPNGTPFRINIWDFGGQEIYHATHQFFLTKRSLYALVVDTRQDNTDLYYWLNVVALLSDNSPVFILKNEKQDRQCEVNEPQLRGEFTHLETVLSANLADNRGLEAFKTALQQRIAQLPHVGTPLPKMWVRVRAALENYAATRNYIPLEDYYQLCRTSQITDKERMLSLSSYLHDLGVILHFHDDPILKHYIILKPAWGTTAVYKALDTKEVRDNYGRFTRAQLDDIWSEQQYADMRDELLQLMMRFKLCYEIPGRPQHYIAPQLLDLDQPDYAWDDSANLILRYHYDFMPKGILTRLIVELHEFIEDQQLVWKTGVVLTNGSARAEVIEYYLKREIHIRVSGQEQKRWFSAISHELEKIHLAYERLQYQALIPCNCSTCKGSQTPYDYPYERLQKFLRDGQSQIQCQESYQMVDVQQLLDDILNQSLESPSDTEADLEANDNLQGLPLQDVSDILSSAQKQTYQPPEPMSPSLNASARLALIRSLNAMPVAQFEELVYALNPPPGILPSLMGAQGNRASALLGWAEGSTGVGLQAVLDVLASYLSLADLGITLEGGAPTGEPPVSQSASEPQPEVVSTKTGSAKIGSARASSAKTASGQADSAKAVFISYAWGGDSEAIVNQIDQTFQASDITLIRDKRDLGFKGQIKAFMEQIGRGKAVIVVISDKYLKSENCMFELVEIAANGDFYDRIFPIVLPDAEIYKPVKRIRYIQHWEQEIAELEEAMKTVSAANLQGFRESIDLYTRIRATIAELTETLKDMNTLTPEMHVDSGFADLFSAIADCLER